MVARMAALGAEAMSILRLLSSVVCKYMTLVCVLALYCGSPRAAYADDVSGSIVGYIYAPDGTPIKGATVRIWEYSRPATAIERRTNGDGFFTALALLPGTYLVSASSAEYYLWRSCPPMVEVIPGISNQVKLRLNPALKVITHIFVLNCPDDQALQSTVLF